MQAVERRKHRRLPVPHDRAQTMLVMGRNEHRAIIADMSSIGIGLLMLKGTPIEVNQKVSLVTEEGISECEVIHTRPEENFLHVGTRRLSEVSFEDVPKYHRTRRYFKETASTSSPLVFLAVVLGFSGVMIGMTLAIDVARVRGSGNGAVTARAVVKAAGEEFDASTRETTEEARPPREILAEEVAAFIDEADTKIEVLQARHSKLIARVLEGTGRKWDQVSEELRITAEQAEQIRTVLDSAPEDQDRVATRSRLMSFLNDGQRNQLAKILATVPAS